MRPGQLAPLLLAMTLLASAIASTPGCNAPAPGQPAASSSSTVALQIPSGRHSALTPQLEPPTSRAGAIERTIAELETDSTPLGKRRLSVLRVVRDGLECRSLGLEAKLGCLERTRDGYRALLKQDGFSESERSSLQAEIDDLTRRIEGFAR